jgi:hypothetical protein
LVHAAISVDSRQPLSRAPGRRRCILFSVLIVSVFLFSQQVPLSAPHSPSVVCPVPAGGGGLAPVTGSLQLSSSLSEPIISQRPPRLPHHHLTSPASAPRTPHKGLANAGDNCRFSSSCHLAHSCCRRAQAPLDRAPHSRIVDGYRWLRYSRQSFRPPEP